MGEGKKGRKDSEDGERETYRGNGDRCEAGEAEEEIRQMGRWAVERGR